MKTTEIAFNSRLLRSSEISVLYLAQQKFEGVFKMAEVNEAQIREWHEEGLKVVSEYKRCESRIVFLLSKLSESQGYLLYKSDSLRQYATCVWGLSEYAARDFVTVAKKAIEVPALIEALESKQTTVSKLRKICPVIDAKNSKEWIDLTIECSARIVERAVAMAKPEGEIEIHDQIKYKAGNRVEMKAGLSEFVMNKLRRVQDLVSQQKRKPATFEEALEACFDQYLEKHDPLKKAMRAMAREKKRAKKETVKTQKANAAKEAAEKEGESADDAAEQKKRVTCRVLGEGAAKPVKRRKKIRAKVRHAVTLRDGDQCIEIGPDGERCTNRRWLDSHHIIPVSEGGTDELENLTTLCWGHHRAHHFAEQIRGDGRKPAGSSAGTHIIH